MRFAFSKITGTLNRARQPRGRACGQSAIGFAVADSSLKRAARIEPGEQPGGRPRYTHILLGIAISERVVYFQWVFSFGGYKIANGAIPTDNATERLVKLEENSKWQNLITNFALGAVLVIALAHVVLTTILVFQRGDLDEKLVGLTTNQIKILDWIHSLPE